MKLRYILLLFILGFSGHSLYGQNAPVEFIENRGQWGNWFCYKAATQSGDILLEKDGFRYVLSDVDNNYKMDYFHHGQTKIPPVLKYHAYKVTFEGALTPEISSSKPNKMYYNYFLGNDPARWKSGIHSVRNVTYSKLYNGIDLNIFSSNTNLEYEFVVHQGADASQVKLKFDGQDSLKIENNNLVVTTSVGQLSEMKPYAYQYINYNKVEVPCNYNLEGNILTYSFPAGYDHTQQLIIDPVVVLCTLTGSTADNWGYTATFDDAGNFYAGGLVNTLSYGGTFPVSPGAFQVTFGGGYGTLAMADSTYACDISIIKYDPTLASRIYATYLGGSGNERPHSMIVDPTGNLIVGGRTRSVDYPVTPGAYQNVNHGGWDIVVTKFNSTCTALLGSTYIGGSGNDGVNFDSTEYGFGQLKYNYGDDARSEVQLDKYGNIYMADCSNSTDFPTTGTAISSSLSGMQDGVVFKFNSTLTSLLWSTYLSGSGSDAGYALAFDTAQTSLYVAGGTNSSDFPSTPGTLYPSYQGGVADGFILKFNTSAPYNLQKGTFIGTPNYDQVYGIQVSSDNSVYVMGQSLGGAFPVTAGVYSNPGSCQFVMKLDSNLATNEISTVFGSGNPAITNISPVAFLVDTCDNVYISGWGGSLGIGLPTSGYCTGMVTTPGAWQTTTDGMDFYFIVLGPNMASLRYATFYGRSCSALWEGEHVDGGTSRFSKQGIIYQGICASCGGAPGKIAGVSCPSAFPTTPGVWSQTDSSENCNEAALKIAFNIGPVQAIVNASPSTSGCAPLTVSFTNLSNNGLTYVWNFGDGSPTVSTFSPTHTFNSAGTFTVTLSASNSNACFKTNDTAYLVVYVDTNRIVPGFTYTLTDSCGPYVAVFTNTSFTNIVSPASTYTWYFGDGTSFTGATPTAHNYPDTGTYSVMMIMANSGACLTPDTVTGLVRIYSTRLSASFSIPDSLCLGVAFQPLVTSTNTTSFTWTFGDGNTSTSADPDYTYKSVGTYTVTLIAKNTGACNGPDTLKEIIKVLSGPVANFSFVPITPTPNMPTTFTNLSMNATRYLWDFGDNTGSTENNPVHQFTSTNTFKTCLTAYNSSNCPSEICKLVPADVEPLIGIPTAFSPNGDGENDILYVRGAAIETMDLKIYNRWGQLVFETTSQEIGWDGTFNGQPQPVEAYGYVLHATFIDGSEKLLKGNITLLR